jgi:FkbH-like protein
MTQESMIDLPWLVVPAADIREELRALRRADAVAWEQVERLSRLRLNAVQLGQLAKSAGRALPQPSTQVSLGVVTNATSELLAPAIEGTAPRFGMSLRALTHPFGTFSQQALDPNSEINLAKPDFVLLAMDGRGLGIVPSNDASSGESQAISLYARLKELAERLRDTSGATVILQTVVALNEHALGGYAGRMPASSWAITQGINRLIRSMKEPGILVLDLALYAEAVGTDRWLDPEAWDLGKFASSHDAIPLHADLIVRLIAAARGRARKCLVLDLDNTLWGGVIGDDGLEGIVIGQGSPLGEAFVRIQETALLLRERGVVLAVSSKNTDEVARTPFRQHPEMRLKESHIAVFQANWNDKASNLEAIAKTLDIGIDSLVFLDDNPVERSQVRKALPQVAVPELPQNPAYYPWTLLAAGYFETLELTREDCQRAEQYQANAARKAILGESADLGEFLSSLEMKASVNQFDSLGRGRITQLINKTNQFNLTTRRYTEQEVAAFERDQNCQTFQFRLTDRFGDNGMIGVIIANEKEDVLEVDTWLMSCRVLKRRIEELMLFVLVGAARARGMKRIRGTFVSTQKNAMVQGHYHALGFEWLSDFEGGSHWILDLDCYRSPELPVIIDLGDIRVA